MHIEIVYETNDDAEFTCCANAEIHGLRYFGIGRTWEQAKENLLKKLDAKFGRVAPPPETVEVKVAGEDMDTEFFPFNAGETRTKDGIPWGPEETTTQTVRRAKVNFEGGQVVNPKDRDIEAGKV